MSRAIALGALLVGIMLIGGACTSTAPVGRAEIASALSPEWAPNRAYLGVMIKQTERRWARSLRRLETYPAAGSSVKVTFRLTAHGTISRILSVDGDAGMIGEKPCVTAIMEGVPFPKWSDEMKSVLGESRELTFTFFYQ